jgi:hypothetical protein
MKSNAKNMEKCKELVLVVALAFACVAIVAGKVESSNPAEAELTQLTFKTPAEAGAALAKAAKTGDQETRRMTKQQWKHWPQSTGG